jgi:hypothetical protein
MDRVVGTLRWLLTLGALALYGVAGPGRALR